MRFVREFPATLRTIMGTLWLKRRIFALAVLAGAVAYHLLVFLILSRGLTEPPTYARLYDLPGNAARIWRSTPALADVLAILENEPVFEFGRMSGSFKAVVWSYQATVHAIWDTGLILLVLGAYLTLVFATIARLRGAGRGACPGLVRSVGSSSFLGMIGTGTGAACCGAISVSLLATILGATASTAFFLSAYERPLIALGYALLGGSLLLQGYRLHRLDGQPLHQDEAGAGAVEQSR